MSGDRARSTTAARDAIQRLQQIVNGPLLNSHWPAIHTRLATLAHSREERRANVALINQNIMSAGGNQ